MDEQDRQHLRAVIEQASAGIPRGHGPFAARLVVNGEVIAEACNSVVLNGDPTAHAEIQVIREASRKLGSHVLEGATLYSSCKPCPMCHSAAHWARIERVVYAAGAQDAATAGFDDHQIMREICSTSTEAHTPTLEQGLEKEGQGVFAAWLAYPQRQKY